MILFKKIGIIGLGFVGDSMYKSFSLKGLEKNINLIGYDKYKDGGIGKFEDILCCDILFLALPTKYNDKIGQYDKKSITDTCKLLLASNYTGVIVIKSTVEPGTTNNLSKIFKKLEFIHNPEFLTARSAFEDFHNQNHIVLGNGLTCSKNSVIKVKQFYNLCYPNADISLCTSLESESMKLFVNCFYSVKVQFFTELYLLCKKNGSDFNVIRNIMLKNKWINPMHTNIPGPDGKISYGGLCFPKDTNALNKYMLKLNTPNNILEATIKERNIMREDNDNCDLKLESKNNADDIDLDDIIILVEMIDENNNIKVDLSDINNI